MPTTVIANKSTTQIKSGAGVLQAIVIANAGTSWTVQVNDGPNLSGNVTAILGATPFTVPAIGTDMLPAPIPFSYGLQIVTAGTTAGEMTLVWYWRKGNSGWPLIRF